MNMRNRKRMALLISICLLFSSYHIGAAAEEGLSVVLPIPSAEESAEPSVTANPAPNATGPSSDESTPTPAVDESPEPSATSDSTPDAAGTTPALADPMEEASAEAPPLEDRAQTPPSGGEGKEGVQSGITIELVGGRKATSFAGRIAQSDATTSSDFNLTRNQIIELQATSAILINGAQWSLSDTSVAEITHTSFSFVVTSSGSYYSYTVKIKGLRTGTTTLSFRNASGTVLRTATIAVTTPVIGIELSDEVRYVGIERSVQLTATVSPADADDSTVNWSSSDESIVSVDKNGAVWGVAEGSATIYAESADGAISAACIVYVGYLTDALQISERDIALNGANISRKLNLSFQPANATYKTARWTSSNPNVAAVDGHGAVTARGNGFAVITAASMDTGASDSVNVTVSGFVNATGVALNATNVVLTTEGRLTSAELTATVTPGSASDRSVTWSVADENIARVDGDGVVVPVSIGTTVVTATTADGLYAASCSIRVIKGKYTLSFYSNPIPNGNGWSMDLLDQNPAYFYGDPVVFPEPPEGYRIEQWYRDFNYETGALNKPVPDGFMPETDMDFYAATVAIRPESVKILGVSAPWAISDSSANVNIYSTFSPSAVVNASYKYISSDPSVAVPDMISEWYTYGGSDGILRGTIKLLKNGTVTISAIMQDGNVTDSITLSIAGLGSGRVNVHTISGQAKLATPVLKSADLLSDTSTTLRWEAAAGADGYEVFCEQVKYDWASKIATVGRETTSYTYVSSGSVIASSGHPLVYSVRAYKNVNGTTVYSGRSNALTPEARVSNLTLSVPENTSMTNGGYDLRVGGTLQIGAKVEPTGMRHTLSFKSSNTKVATVSSTGLVKGIKTGKVTVTVTAKDSAGLGSQVRTLQINVITPVSKVTLPTEAQLLTGKTKKLTAALSPSSPTYKAVAWVSDNEDVATVGADGTIVAKAAGTAKVTATAHNGLSASCIVRVTEPATSVAVKTATGNLYVNHKAYLSLMAAVSPAEALGGVTWKSSNTKYATVDANGRVYGKAVGKATITATAKDGTGVRGSVSIQVITPVKGVSLPETEGVFIGRTKKLTAKLAPSSPTFKALTWSSSDESVATVAADGTVKALTLGETVITAQAYNGLSDSCTLRVTQPAERISLAPANGFTLVYKGERVALLADIAPENAGNKVLTWKSSNMKVATVDAQGVVTGKAAGSVKITATAKDGSKVYATIGLTVAAPETSIKLNKTSAILYLNGQTSLKLTTAASPKGAKVRGLAWTVASGDAVTVDDQGVVTAVREGKAVVRATTQRGFGAECAFEVRALPTALTLNTTEKTLAYNTSYDLRADVEMDGSEPALTWSTSNGKIATVSSSGVVKATGKAGKATITATAKNGLKATCVITVVKN